MCKVLRALIEGTLADLVMPASTLTYAREDLEALGLVQNGGLSDWAVDRLQKAGFTAAPQPKRRGIQAV